jgi:short-subunit dehydrogenase
MKDQIHNLLNKAAIVTGASQGIGAIIAFSE